MRGDVDTSAPSAARVGGADGRILPGKTTKHKIAFQVNTDPSAIDVSADYMNPETYAVGVVTFTNSPR